MNPAQYSYITSIKSNIITFGVGPAGAGKTYLAVSLAAQELVNKRIQRIVVTRPIVDSNIRKIGALPGLLQEKFDPYIAPIHDVLVSTLGEGYATYAIKAKQVDAIPLEFMRGLSIDDAWIILDEAQNTTPDQMKMFLTRIGQNCTVVINGDIDQSDLPRGALSGLKDALDRFDNPDFCIPSIGIVRFTEDDIVRSGIVRDILRAYARKQP